MNNDIMVTPNAFTGTSSIYNFDTRDTTVVEHTDLLALSKNAFTVPIATGMHSSGEKYYVANLLDQTVTCVSTGDAACHVDNDGDGTVDAKPILLVTGLLSSFLK